MSLVEAAVRQGSRHVVEFFRLGPLQLPEPDRRSPQMRDLISIREAWQRAWHRPEQVWQHEEHQQDGWAVLAYAMNAPLPSAGERAEKVLINHLGCAHRRFACI